MQQILHHAARAALDFLLPAACASCGRLMDNGEPGLACGRCWTRLRLLPFPQCERCGHPGLGACEWCKLLPPCVRSVRSVCWMHVGSGAQIVHALKYGGWHALAAEISERIGRLTWPADVVGERSLIVPVPLSRARQRERGFNQSELLARPLAERWRVPARSDVLERTRATRTQTLLTPEQRQTNVAGAFRVREAARTLVAGAHVIMIDDVVTTASTLNECAGALARGGARAVSYATFGRAPAIRDRQRRLP